MLKTTAIKIMTGLDVAAPVRFINRQKVPILMYHRFSRDEAFGKTSHAAFTAHLSYLTKHYKIVSLDELIQHRLNGKSVSSGLAVITIDDGYRDFYDIAFPILKKFDVTATIYVVTNFVDGKEWIWTDKARFIVTSTAAEKCEFVIGTKRIAIHLGDHETRLKAAGAINSELKKLPDKEKDAVLQALALHLNVVIPDLPPDDFEAFGWDEAREMLKDGIEIGSHTANHPILTNVDAETLLTELEISKSMLEDNLQRASRHFCYPNGNVLRRERDAAVAAGYQSAVTTDLRLSERTDDPFLLPRVDAEPEMHRFMQATSGADRLRKIFR